jgi:phosphatidylglycerol:prolipoprotein diacylglycerol transferase
MANMLMHPQFDPVALQLGPVAIHWYGITYLVAFALFLFLAKRRLQHQPYAEWVAQGKWAVQDVDDLLTFGVIGVVLGGRVGYCLFYKLSYYADHPIEVFYVWQGGMSFHGGMLGVIAAMALFAWQRKRPWLAVTDFIAYQRDWPRAEWVTSSTASYGVEQQTLTYLGRWRFLKLDRYLHDILHRCTNFWVKACCCSQ